MGLSYQEEFTIPLIWWMLNKKSNFLTLFPTVLVCQVGSRKNWVAVTSMFSGIWLDLGGDRL